MALCKQTVAHYGLIGPGSGKQQGFLPWYDGCWVINEVDSRYFISCFYDVWKWNSGKYYTGKTTVIIGVYDQQAYLYFYYTDNTGYPASCNTPYGYCVRQSPEDWSHVFPIISTSVLGILFGKDFRSDPKWIQIILLHPSLCSNKRMRTRKYESNDWFTCILRLFVSRTLVQKIKAARTRWSRTSPHEFGRINELFVSALVVILFEFIRYFPKLILDVVQVIPLEGIKKTSAHNSTRTS